MPEVAVVGTTASGKSDLAVAVARSVPGVEIVSVDSMCVYREMDIATAKPIPAVRAEIPHHLIDLVDPDEEFTVAQFQAAARAALADIRDRGRTPLLVGGTGLYLRAVVDDLRLPGRWPEVACELQREADQPDGLERLHARLAVLDPLAASRIGVGNRRRIVRALEVSIGSGEPFSSYGPGLGSYPPTRFRLIGIPFDPEATDRRIAARVEGWMEAGLLREVSALAGRPGGVSRTARQALGYRELLAHVEDGVPLQDCVEATLGRTRAFARRQWSWFRRDPRVRWLSPGEEQVQAVARAVAGHPV